jgi:hypothetical protein
VLDEQIALMRRGQEVLGEVPLDQVTPAQARADFVFYQYSNLHVKIG